MHLLGRSTSNQSPPVFFRANIEIRASQKSLCCSFSPQILIFTLDKFWGPSLSAHLLPRLEAHTSLTLHICTIPVPTQVQAGQQQRNRAVRFPCASVVDLFLQTCKKQGCFWPTAETNRIRITPSCNSFPKMQYLRPRASDQAIWRCSTINLAQIMNKNKTTCKKHIFLPGMDKADSRLECGCQACTGEKSPIKKQAMLGNLWSPLNKVAATTILPNKVFVQSSYPSLEP